ncbi:MAG: hypothetical protein HZB16_14865 [Armatimonadetes bacterium]|nr:hypothetical protein [Armatimonadota bacterium]
MTMRGVFRAWCAALLCAVCPALAGEVDLGGTSFEVGAGSYCLRGAADESVGDRPSLDRAKPAEGAVCVRWPVRRGGSTAAVEWPPRDYAAGQPVLISVMMRSEPAGLPAALSVHSAPEAGRGASSAVIAQAGYALSAEWRRYELTWTPEPGATRAWVEIAPGAAATSSVWWVDDLRLGLADGEPAEVRPELGVSLAGGALRWAGQVAQFRVRLRSPRRVPDVAWNWRLETASGQVNRRFAGLLTLHDGLGAAEVRVGALPPGAYRLVAEALVEGHALAAADSVVLVEPQLGELPRWGGVEGVSALGAVPELVLLRLGRLRGAVGSDAPPTTGAFRAKLLTSARHEGIDTLGYWPADEQALAAWSRLVNWWEPPAGELWRSVAEDGDRLRARHKALRGLGRLCGVRLDARSDTLTALGDIAEEGLLSCTEALAVQAAPGAPEPVADLPWQGLRARAEGKPLWLLLAGQPAEPWNAVGEGDPMGASARRQAAWLARGILLARAAGVDGVWYPGAPTGLGAERLTMAQRGVGADLIDECGRPQPAVAAMCWALDAMRGRRADRPVEAPAGVRLQLYAGRRPLLAAWCTEPGATAELRLGLGEERVEVRDVGGTPISLPAGELRVPFGESPVYIEPRGGSLTAFAGLAASATVTLGGGGR